MSSGSFRLTWMKYLSWYFLTETIVALSVKDSDLRAIYYSSWESILRILNSKMPFLSISLSLNMTKWFYSSSFISFFME